MYEDLAKELKRNTQIIQSTFNAFNLQVLQVGYHPYGVEDDSEESDADCDCLVEVSALNDGPMTHDACRIACVYLSVQKKVCKWCHCFTN